MLMYLVERPVTTHVLMFYDGVRINELEYACLLCCIHNYTCINIC